ncbi:SRPBCC domain-containing protein [Mesorhizobium sp. BE184]|uniref:SRPBCC family protein n=1 Tax=Mesorhizobium sp. BE184 TaxID=2817714 RepID=UPI002854E5B5|nr:SRPBCC domain-containing protein [Mesorhizobium sp. BE184]MDR7032500.1 uncharacterized protein YndB with AHSA1/START domain [Mesorhizobium sp. BE184]
MTEKPAAPIVVECDLAEPPEKVWRALTVPELLAAWLLPNDMDPAIEAGSRFQLRPGAAPIECEVLEADPCRLLRYSWRERDDRENGDASGIDSTVSFELARSASGGTRLRIVHGDFAAIPAVALAGVPTCRLTLSGKPRPRPAPANTIMLLRAA